MIIAIISLLLGACVFLLFNSILELHLISGAAKFFKEVFIDFLGIVLVKIGKHNSARRLDKTKRQKIIHTKEGLFDKYNRLIEFIIHNLGFRERYGINIETFHTISGALFGIVVLVILLLSRNLALSFIVSFVLTILIIAFFSDRSRARNNVRLEAIADAEDLICPFAKDGVYYAIKKVMETDEYLHKSIRPYFYEFLKNYESRGYSFREAMQILNQDLGTRFDNFAEKAIIFESSERKGMSEIFKDIVDENSVVREINIKKEALFRKMNRDFWLKTLLIILFFLYSLTNEGFNHFMLNTGLGNFIVGISIITICVAYVGGQFLQNSIELKSK